MRCPYCKNDSQVVNSRLQKRSNSVWRRRKCVECSAKWTSSERIEATLAYRVEKGDKLHSFTPEILLISLYEACRHRKAAAIDANYVFSTVMQKLQAKNQAVLPTKVISKTCYDILRRYDTAAAAVYKATHHIK